MNSDQGLELWNAKWVLMNGFVVCSVCMQKQSLSSSCQAFVHEDGCRSAAEGDVLPWVDLHDILDNARG